MRDAITRKCELGRELTRRRDEEGCNGPSVCGSNNEGKDRVSHEDDLATNGDRRLVSAPKYSCQRPVEGIRHRCLPNFRMVSRGQNASIRGQQRRRRQQKGASLQGQTRLVAAICSRYKRRFAKVIPSPLGCRR